MNVYVRSKGKIFGPVDFSKVALACQDGLFAENAEISEDRIEWLSIAEAQELLRPKNAAPISLPSSDSGPTPILKAIPLQPLNPDAASASPVLAQPLILNSIASPPPTMPGGQQPILRPITQLPRFAGFWKRFAAYLIDIFVLSPITVLFWFVSGLVSGGMLNLAIQKDLPASVAIIISSIFQQVLSIIICWLYYAIMESSTLQGTLGKKLLGIKVTDLSGKPIGFGKASGRFFGKTISSLILGVGFLLAAFTEKKQALHDMLAGCLVVDRE